MPHPDPYMDSPPNQQARLFDLIERLDGSVTINKNRGSWCVLVCIADGPPFVRMDQKLSRAMWKVRQDIREFHEPDND